MMNLTTAMRATMRKFSWMMALLFSMGLAAGGVSAGALVDDASPQTTTATHFAGGDEGGEVNCEQQPTHPDCQ